MYVCMYVRIASAAGTHRGPDAECIWLGKHAPELACGAAAMMPASDSPD